MRIFGGLVYWTNDLLGKAVSYETRSARSVRVGKMKRSAKFRRAFHRSLKQVDLALLVREMRDAAKLSQVQLAERAGTTQSVIARLEDAEDTAHSLQTLEKIAGACGVTLTLHAQKKPKLELEVALA